MQLAPKRWRNGDRGGQWWDPSRWLAGYIGLLLAGFGLVTLGPSLIGRRTLISVDLLTQHFPYRTGGNLSPGHEVCTTDTVDSVMPLIAEIRNRILNGHSANWTSLTAGGGPLGSVPSMGLVDPLSLPYFLVPLRYAPVFVMLVQLAVSIGGTYLFLRLLGTSRAAGLLAGFVYATSGFMVMWSNWPQTRVGALVPLLLWAVERVVQRRRVVDAVPLALVIAALLFGGFPQVSGFAVYLAAGYLVVRLIVLHRTNIRAAVTPFAVAVGGTIIGGLLAAVQMLPFLHQYADLNTSYRPKGQGGLPSHTLSTVIAPNAYGLCINGGPPIRSLVSPVEVVAYIGAGALVLAVLGAAATVGPRVAQRARGARGYFVAAVVVTTVLIWFSARARRVTAHLPIFGDGFLPRLRIVFGLACAVLVGLGLDALSRRRAERAGAATTEPAARSASLFRRHGWAAAVWIITAMVGIDVLFGYKHYANINNFSREFRSHLIVPLVLVAVTVVAVVVARASNVFLRGAALLAVPAIVVVQATIFFHTVLPGDSTKAFYPVTPVHKFLKANVGHDRFGSEGLNLSDTAAFYGLRETTGHFFAQSLWGFMLSAVDNKVFGSPTNLGFSQQVTPATVSKSPLLDRMGVTYFAFTSDAIAGTVGTWPATDSTIAVPQGQPASCAVPGGPVRGIAVKFANDLNAVSGNGGVRVDLTLRDGSTTLTSGRYLINGATAGSIVEIPLAGEKLPAGNTMRATLTFAGGTGPAKLAASSAQLVCAPITPAADNLSLVFADAGAIVYKRLTALPRIRWASNARVVPGDQVATLQAGVPSDTVLLSAPDGSGGGKPATVSAIVDQGDSISAHVAAQGSGYLVVADAMQQPGWSVTVDGHAATLVHADEAMVAVNVPSGDHVVRFHYRAPGQVAGMALTGVGVLASLGLLGWELIRRRRAAHP